MFTGDCQKRSFPFLIQADSTASPYKMIVESIFAGMLASLVWYVLGYVYLASEIPTPMLWTALTGLVHVSEWISFLSILFMNKLHCKYTAFVETVSKIVYTDISTHNLHPALEIITVPLCIHTKTF